MHRAESEVLHFLKKNCRFAPGVIGCGRIVQVKLKVVNIPLA